MSNGDPFGRRPDKSKPKIWAEGGQRPPFDLRGLGTSTLYLSRLGVAPLHAWAARTARRVAVNVKNGVGRIPAGKLGRAARFVPSHLRVAGWIKNVAAVLSHASATADPNVKRGNALVAEIEPHLWAEAGPVPAVGGAVAGAAAPGPVASEPPPVVLAEPVQPGDDPLASIRGEMGGAGTPGRNTGPARQSEPDAPDLPPDPPGPLATGVIQVSGYLIGWASSLVALPYGLVRALWLYAKGADLRTLAAEE